VFEKGAPRKSLIIKNILNSAQAFSGGDI